AGVPGSPRRGRRRAVHTDDLAEPAAPPSTGLRIPPRPRVARRSRARGEPDARAVRRGATPRAVRPTDPGGNAMQCEVCGNDYDKPLEISFQGQQHVFDSFECAIHALAPTRSEE